MVRGVEQEAGLFDGFAKVWLCEDGEAALRTMLEATLRFWTEAWVFIQFGLRVRRVDVELGARFDRLDQSRLGHLVVICRRLRQEKRLRPHFSAEQAALLVFALTTPYVYEALSTTGGLSAAEATRMVVAAATGAVVDPATHPQRSPAIDWVKLGLEPPVT